MKDSFKELAGVRERDHYSEDNRFTDTEKTIKNTANCMICGADFIKKGNKKTCSKECSKKRKKRYNKLPESKARIKLWGMKFGNALKREHRKLPKVKAREKQLRDKPDAKEKKKAYGLIYRNIPANKKKAREYNSAYNRKKNNVETS